MSAVVEQLKPTLSHLTSSERAELAQYLLHTLESEEEGTKMEWLTLAEQRMTEVRAGRVVGIPAERLFEELRRPR